MSQKYITEGYFLPWFMHTSQHTQSRFKMQSNTCPSYYYNSTWQSRYTFIIFSTESPHLLKHLSHDVMSFATPLGPIPITNNALHAEYSQ